MKEKRKSNKKLFFTFGAILAVTAILAAVKVIYTPVNNVSIGWVEHKQSDLWEADYAYFTGTQTSNLQGLNTKLNIDVETDDGSLEISVKDTDDNVLFSETISETTSFSVEAPEIIIPSAIIFKRRMKG